MLQFNFVNYKLIFIFIFMYSYCYLLSVLGILFQCVVLDIPLCTCVLYYCHRECERRWILVLLQNYIEYSKDW